MVTTTSGEDDEAPKRDQGCRNDPLPGLGSDDAGRQTVSRIGATADLAAQLAATADHLRSTLGNEASWLRIRDLVAGVTLPQAKHRVGRDQIVNVNVGTQTNVETQTHAAVPQPAPLGKPTLAEQRQKFHFEFLKHALKQAEWTFRLSVWFMTGGAVVILVGAVLALLHAGSPSHGYVPLVTSLTGALITVGGGALAVHARRARSHVTEQAQRIEDKIDADHQLETATTFIDRVQDKDAKDRLNAAAAMKALNMQANQTMVNRLLPSDQAKQIEPGDPTN